MHALKLMHVHDFQSNPMLNTELEMVIELDTLSILQGSATSTIDMSKMHILDK